MTIGQRRTACDLCEAARITRWYSEDEVCWVADCEICDVPMVVWRTHGAVPPEAEREHMVAQLAVVADARFGAGGWSLDAVMRQIPDHFHAHARDPHWWSRRFGPRRSPVTAIEHNAVLAGHHVEGWPDRAEDAWVVAARQRHR